MAHITIFSKLIRTLDGLYSLNDLHKASGSEKKHEPNRFIRIEKTQSLIAEIERYPEMGIGVNAIKGGTNQGTWVCKELVYAYAMWISAKFHLHVIRAFDRLALSSDALSCSELPHSNQNNEATKTMAKLLEGNILALAQKRSQNNTLVENIKIGEEVNKHLGVSKLDQATPAQLEQGLIFIQTALEGEYLSRADNPTNEYVASMERRVALLKIKVRI
ncbi:MULTISPECIES: KilA-N domain-containing protein [unclassified Marinomonas]|uniref:KilA-N domain-containing protein n=1 Tax=unclassified Marinomonas TaxID=196814 RepID=UPI0007AF75E2|nr:MULTISPECIES: KilA-N domain-containing protein [unclassified Marinomonas]